MNCPSKHQTSHRKRLISGLLALVAGLGACTGDVNNPPDELPVVTTGNAGNGAYTLQLGSTALNLREGDNAVLSLQIERSSGHNLPVTLALEGQSQVDEENLDWQFIDSRIDAEEAGTELELQLMIGVKPILAQNRVVRVIATDGRNAPVAALFTLQITPTPRADVYLLIGQSNMVGFSQAGAKQVESGQADERIDRILQINVTGNDEENFDVAADFTNTVRLAAADPRYVSAVDPLHDGFDVRIDGKESGRIGLGLSFAKRALPNTSAQIYLVPAAWSDTGFCRRDTNALIGLGWNATAQTDPAFSGTLLHDRAIARTNLVLRETDGILRGILWHQGEADSDDASCAQAYAQNIQQLVASLRSNIVPDARGAAARGPDSDIPFVVGTMSKGGEFAPFDDIKAVVDGVHRNISNLVPNSAVVNNDDLVPPGFACGEGSCIHFGAAAYREMGSRYYDQLLGI